MIAIPVPSCPPQQGTPLKTERIRSIVGILAAFLCPVAEATPLKLVIMIEDSKGVTMGANIVFDENEALEYGPEISGVPLARFQLDKREWVEGEQGQHFTIAQARAWAEASKARAVNSLSRVNDPDQRAFVESLLSPAFDVSRSDGLISLKSRFISYTASAPLAASASLRKAIFAYDELNAYRKAMVHRQAPPFTQLEVTRVLMEADMFPGSLISEITTPNGSIRVLTTYRLIEMTPEEQAAIVKRTSSSSVSPKPGENR